jgi:phage-related protein
MSRINKKLLSERDICTRFITPLCKSLGRGLFELRHVGKLNTRVLWFFVKGRRIITVHGIRNKGQTILARDLDIARARMRDWHERFEK